MQKSILIEASKNVNVSVWRTAGESLLSNKSAVLWIADFTPVTWTAQTCSEPATCI